MNMKNLFLLLILAISLPDTASAQKFLDKVLKGVEKTNKILDETDKILGVDSQSSSSTRRGGGFQITSPHPDIAVQFKRCAIAGSTAILDLVITNYGKDATIQLGGSSNQVYDDTGNQYPKTNVSIADGKMISWDQELFPTEVPLKFRMEIYDVASKATTFKRINLNIYSKTIKFSEPIILCNVPISRMDNTVRVVADDETESTEETSTLKPEKKVVDEDFETFEEKFIAYPRFQLQRIKFDNLGYNGEDEKWTQDNWNIFKTKPSDMQNSDQYKYEQKLSDNQCIQRIWIPDSEFILEYTYSKINGKWYLVKASERF